MKIITTRITTSITHERTVIEDVHITDDAPLADTRPLPGQLVWDIKRHEVARVSLSYTHSLMVTGSTRKTARFARILRDGEWIIYGPVRS